MPDGDVETFYDHGQWRNKVLGDSRVSSVHETKAAATALGEQIAAQRRVEHVIRNMDGTIGERSSYWNDPRDVPG